MHHSFTRCGITMGKYGKGCAARTLGSPGCRKCEIYLYHFAKKGVYHKNQGSILYHFGSKNGGLSGRAYPYSFTMGVPPPGFRDGQEILFSVKMPERSCTSRAPLMYSPFARMSFCHDGMTHEVVHNVGLTNPDAQIDRLFYYLDCWIGIKFKI